MRVQIRLVGGPCHPVHPRGHLAREREVGGPESVHGDMVEERGELRPLVLLCCSMYTLEPLGTRVRRCVRGVESSTAWSLTTSLPSIPSATPASLSVLFGDFVGTTDVSDFHPPYILGVRLDAFPRRPTWPSPLGSGWISRFSRMECRRMCGVSDRARERTDSPVTSVLLLPSA